MTKPRILLVEDDADTRRGLELRLTAWGYETSSASDSVSALGLARSAQPDLVLLDLGLPGGDGLVLLERLKALATTKMIPVVVLTAREPGASRQSALDLGAVAFLQKPAENEELKAAIEAHRRRAAPEAAGAGAALKVLLVEDDADTRLGLTLRLRAEGYEVATVADARRERTRPGIQEG
jgi:DNA-binding response OmpR family regulator